MRNWKTIYWFVIFSLLLIPVANSFFIGFKKVIDSVLLNTKHKEKLTELAKENEKIRDKVKYYKTDDGVKALVKDRINKVEEGEYIIKYNKK